jgi:hypothetical protein
MDTLARLEAARSSVQETLRTVRLAEMDERELLAGAPNLASRSGRLKARAWRRRAEAVVAAYEELAAAQEAEERAHGRRFDTSREPEAVQLALPFCA